MIQFMQLEKRNSGAVNTNEAVRFNLVVQSGGSDITYNMTDGRITFRVPGVYYLNWFVAQQTGLSTNGSNFAIIASTPMSPYITGSNHVKISQTNGFAIIKTDVANVTARLINTADASAQLSDTTQVKAGLAVIGFMDSTEVTPALGYMQAQVTAATVTLADSQAIDFVQIIEHDPDMIVEKNNTEFILKDRGTYLVTWEIPVDATDTRDYADITILYNGTAHSTAHMPLPIGVLSGSAMIVNAQPDGVIELINTTGDTVRITGKANIVITQITKLPEPVPIEAQLDISGTVYPGLLDIEGAIKEFSLNG